MNAKRTYPALALAMSPGGDRRNFARCVVFLWSLVLPTAGCDVGGAPGRGELTPLVDHHQHLLSPALAKTWSEPEHVDAELLIKRLDKAGIRSAVVMSVAYAWGSPGLSPKPVDEYMAVRAENDWTAEQVARYPDRLTAVCSVNPLRDYALAEIERCAADPRLRNGLKMQFANSRVNLRVPEHVAQLRRVFAAANQRRMPILAHVWTGDDKVANPFDGRDARTFIDEVLPMAPDVTVQITHLGGSGPRLDPGTEEAMVVLAEAAARGDAAMKNVYFDVATNIHPESPTESVEFMTARMRQIGMSRLLYGSDAATGGNPVPVKYWRALRDKSGLTPSELETIAGNVAPYLRR
jgi:predicted TIM-barrel fold metal-dependent hydrolase